MSVGEPSKWLKQMFENNTLYNQPWDWQVSNASLLYKVIFSKKNHLSINNNYNNSI